SMKLGSAEVMWPIKAGDAVSPELATSLSSRNWACSETNTGFSGMTESAKFFSTSDRSRSTATMCSWRNPARLREMFWSMRLRVDSGASGTVKTRYIASIEAWADFFFPVIEPHTIQWLSEGLVPETLRTGPGGARHLSCCPACWQVMYSLRGRSIRPERE